jgi:ribosomal protein L29
MSEEVKTKAQKLSEELANLKAALQTATGGVDPQVQEIVSRMEEILQPAA